MKSPPPASALESHLGYWLRLVSNHVSHSFSLKVEAHGVTVAEWVVMRELLGVKETAPSAVAEKLGLTRGAVSKLVERLVAKGLVSRAAGQGDRRYQSIALTRGGRALVPQLAALADANDAEFFGHLGSREQTALMQTLQDLARRHGLKSAPLE